MNEKGEFEGKGVLYYPNGSICYEGTWKENKFHGYGILHNFMTSLQKIAWKEKHNLINYQNFGKNNLR